MWYQDGDSVFEELYKTLLPFGKIYHYRPGGAPRQVKDEDQTLLRYMQAVGVPAAQVTAFRRAGGLEGNGPPLVPFTGEDLEDFGEDYTSALPSLIRPYLFISKYTDVIVSKNQANNRPP
ncbi:hypothetical protein M427DRAFT_135046 [Gonapodya prolifera JEL478]|uniref:Uncharacterized protein n=1 Tax=Gonapodya prolifera (strain JEL478) TaxID=1344416 RepID=A0A139AGP4_GONPJ|nr:hypothetical protein M427DRAFT_135046 [Gonapodya prolifera JEL478]|eukprot:KXS15583.1 hypothetical protein M427DRAFT_135046 [Gonapodya prolifera JEL478]